VKIQVPNLRSKIGKGREKLRGAVKWMMDGQVRTTGELAHILAREK